MYHPGRILELLSKDNKSIKSSDESTQAVVEMWDENHFTFLVDDKISKKVKKNDIVLVDYTPISEKIPMPRHTIVKIINGKLGDDVWRVYKKLHDKNKLTLSKSMQANSPQNYMG